MYRVLNDNNVYVNVIIDDIDNNLKLETPLKREIIMAMGKTHKMEYLTYLYPYLNDEKFYIRRDAAQSIFLINGKEGINRLKQREQQLDESDFETEPSEKAFLQAMIIRIEKGTDGAEEYFFSEQGNEIVKYVQVAYYEEGYLYKEDDIKLIIKILNAYVEKKIPWIIRLPKSEYMEAIFFTLQSIWYAKDSTGLLQSIEDNLCDQLCIVFQKVSEMKIDSDIMEMIADITIGMRKEYAIKILKVLKGRVRGDAKKAYKRSLKFFGLEDLL